MDYPKNLGQMNVYVNENFSVDIKAFDIRFRNVNLPEQQIPKGSYHKEDFPVTLARFLKENLGRKWVLSDENQIGLRGWFEFVSHASSDSEKELVAVVFIRADARDDLTNIATKREGIEGHRIHKAYGRFTLLVTDEDGEYSAGTFDRREQAEQFFNYYIARDPSKTVVSE